MFIKIYLSFIIKIKEKFRIFSDISGVWTDDHFCPGTAYNENRLNCKNYWVIRSVQIDNYSV